MHDINIHDRKHCGIGNMPKMVQVEKIQPKTTNNDKKRFSKNKEDDSWQWTRLWTNCGEG